MYHWPSILARFVRMVACAQRTSQVYSSLPFSVTTAYCFHYSLLKSQYTTVYQLHVLSCMFFGFRHSGSLQWKSWFSAAKMDMESTAKLQTIVWSPHRRTKHERLVAVDGYYYSSTTAADNICPLSTKRFAYKEHTEFREIKSGVTGYWPTKLKPKWVNDGTEGK